MKIRYTLRAFADRESIFEYLERQNPQAARRVIGLIDRRIRQLTDQPGPYKGQRTSRTSIYTLLIAPYPYRIFYSANADEIEIIHIRHSSRRRWNPD